jgi:EpsI family protein
MMISTSSPIIRTGVVVFLALLVVLSFHVGKPIAVGSATGVVMNLPSSFGPFQGRDVPLSEGERVVLPKDTEIIKKNYNDPSGDIVNAQIVLSGAEKRSIHRPELCLPAQGWSITSRATRPVQLADGRSISVMEDTITREVEVSPGVSKPLTSLFCYWFIGDGTTTSSHVMRVFLTSWDRVVHGKNHRWAYAAVSAPVLQGFQPGGRDLEGTRKLVNDFIGQLAPSIMKK